MTTQRKPKAPTPHEVDRGGKVFYVEGGKVYEGRKHAELQFCTGCAFAQRRLRGGCGEALEVCGDYRHGMGSRTLHPVQARMSGEGHNYEAAHGTQAAQAKAQATRGTVEADGPWRLERWTVRDDKPVRVVLDNSARSTRAEAERLRDQIEDANDIRWSVVRCEDG